MAKESAKWKAVARERMTGPGSGQDSAQAMAEGKALRLVLARAGGWGRMTELGSAPAKAEG